MFNPFDIIDAAALEEVFGDPFCNEPEDIIPDYPLDEDNMAHLLPLDRYEDRRVQKDTRALTHFVVTRSGQCVPARCKEPFNHN